MVGLIPAYAKSAQNKLYAIGGMTSGRAVKTGRAWTDINSDRMRPAKAKQTSVLPNLPHVNGRAARFGDHIDGFVAGFEHYATFLLQQSRGARQGGLLDGFAGLPVRTVVRPTRFYYMLLQRLRHHRTMEDGVMWSAQADFLARLADWQDDCDPVWPLQRAERSALLALNVPHFTSPSDGHAIGDAAGVAVETAATSGIDRARARIQDLDARDIGWQIEVIRQNTTAVSRTAAPPPAAPNPMESFEPDTANPPANGLFIAEADSVAGELSRRAVRRGTGAAWIGLDWLGDSEVSQLVALGPGLYDGTCGIAVILAAHAAVTGDASSRELALAAVAHVRANLHSRNSGRIARSLGLGAGTGLGSIVYAFAVMSRCLRDDGLLADAHAAAALFTDDLIAADNQLDIMGGSAGGIVGLLRLHRDSPSDDVLRRATRCGEHLLGQRRSGPDNRGSWIGLGQGEQAPNGMSHGAAGFGYALASLAAVTGRADFATAASDCIAFENASFDPERSNWPDYRGGGEPHWPCQWCHGATGIGLARIATAKRTKLDRERLSADIRKALRGVDSDGTKAVDTLCCGTLGGIEFLCEAGVVLDRSDLRDRASQRLATIIQAAAAAGDYRWGGGSRQFNLGLFRGLAGVGYTALRQVDRSLPNILIWE